MKWRSYSIVSSENPRKFYIYTNENKDSLGNLSYFTIGQDLAVTGPHGCSQYFDYSKRLIIVSKNIGIAPCISLVDKYIEYNNDALVFWSIRKTLGFESFIKKCQASNNITLNIYQNGSKDMLNNFMKDINFEEISDTNNLYTYISGPSKFINLVKNRIYAKGYNSKFYDDMA